MANRGELQKQVDYCLKNFPKTRNSDIELTLAIWKHYYPSRIVYSKTGVSLIRLRDLFDLPREDNVKRIRAKIQNELGKYLPTSLEVAKQRKIAETEWREYMIRFPIEKVKEEVCQHGLPLIVMCPDCNK